MYVVSLGNKRYNWGGALAEKCSVNTVPPTMLGGAVKAIWRVLGGGARQSVPIWHTLDIQLQDTYPSSSHTVADARISHTDAAYKDQTRVTRFEPLELSIRKPQSSSIVGIKLADEEGYFAPDRPLSFPQVTDVYAGSPAAEGLLALGDRLVSVNGKRVGNATKGASMLKRARRDLSVCVLRPADLEQAMEWSLSDPCLSADPARLSEQEEGDFELALALSTRDTTGRAGAPPARNSSTVPQPPAPPYTTSKGKGRMHPT